MLKEFNYVLSEEAKNIYLSGNDDFRETYYKIMSDAITHVSDIQPHIL